jgi:hypothetical protein
MPYLLLGTVGFLIYCSYRAGQRKAAQDAIDIDAPG